MLIGTCRKYIKFVDLVIKMDCFLPLRRNMSPAKDNAEFLNIGMYFRVQRNF